MRIAFAVAFFLCAPTLSEGLAQSFHGYSRTDDCSGHEAGYRWAEDQAVTTVDDCSGNSNSFIEGCSAYVEENYPVSSEYETTPPEE